MLRFDAPFTVAVDAFWVIERGKRVEIDDRFPGFICCRNFVGNTTAEDGASTPFTAKLLLGLTFELGMRMAACQLDLQLLGDLLPHGIIITKGESKCQQYFIPSQVLILNRFM